MLVREVRVTSLESPSALPLKMPQTIKVDYSFQKLKSTIKDSIMKSRYILTIVYKKDVKLNAEKYCES